MDKLLTLKAKQLIGSWTLDVWRIEYSDGRITYPFGDDASGQIIYSADGNMSATISANARSPLSSSNVRQADNNEKAKAYDSYFHYAGNWITDNHDVVHKVTTSLNPAFVGTKQRRRAQLSASGSKLQLSAQEEIGDDISRKHILDWQRTSRL